MSDRPYKWGEQPDGIGISLSGGGIRSASYCLGALQAMEHEGMLFGPDDKPERARYLSAVSGGSYIATAMTLVTKGPVHGAVHRGDRSIVPPQGDPGHGPDLRPFAPGTPEERWVRDHTLYLESAKGGIPGTIWRAVLGVLFNVLIVALVVGIVALPLGWLYGWVWPGLRAHCPDACAYGGAWSVPPVLWTATAIAAGVALFTGFVWIVWWFHRDWRRTAWGSVSGVFLVATFVILLLGIAIPGIIHLARPPQTATANAATVRKGTVAASTAGLVALVLTWIAAARRIVSNASGVEKLAVDAAKGFVTKRRSLAIKIVAFVGGPVFLFSAVTIVAYYGAGYPPRVSGTSGQLAFWAWVGVGVVLFVFWRLADVTTWSLYPFYRRRLCSAFALGRVRRDDLREPSPTAVGHADAAERPYAFPYPVAECQPADFPHLIICASANVSDKGATPSGSNVTSFVFSRDAIGGPLVGAVGAEEFKQAMGKGMQSRFTTLPTAMAISGAAFAPSMGKMTKPWLRLYMALANLRLGVWIPNPRRLELFASMRNSKLRRMLPRLDYFLREMFGRNHLDAPFLYVTDGGHYENLGLVELLRRKCRTIWAIDASGDKIDTFNTLGGALRTAESELGIHFQIDPKGDMAPTDDDPGPDKPWFVKASFSTGTFTYPDATHGRLVVVKAGVPADAPWSIRSYQVEHPKFPCDPTMDQLFDAERFDAYRELGRFAVGQALAVVDPHGEPLSTVNDGAPEDPAPAGPEPVPADAAPSS